MPEVEPEGLNKDYKERDQIIFGREITWGSDADTFGGTLQFEDLTLTQLEKLRDNRFLELDDAQNNAPTISRFMLFMKEHKGVLAHGYAVSPTRDDYRVSIEGLEFCGECTTEMQLAFSRLCRSADEIEITGEHLYCWYD